MTAATFLPNGHPLQPGEIFANPHLAATLETIGKGGRDAFYKGPIARAIVADMRKRDGLLDERDFTEHHADWTEPISTSYRGYDVYEMPLNTQGATMLEMLHILEGFDVKSMGYNSPEYLHALIEAARVNHGNDGLQIESAVPMAVREALIQRGHKVTESIGSYGGYQGILLDPRTGVLMGRSDVRKDGLAIGY